MTDRPPPDSLSTLLDRLEESVIHDGRTSVGHLLEEIGQPSFGPMLVAIGVAGVTPISGVPTVPSLLGFSTAVVALQLLIGRKHFWLPGAMLRKHVTRGRLRSSIGLARKPARFVDRLLKPRLEFFTGALGTRLVAAVCVLIAFAVPPLELLPFAAALPSLAIAAFGLGLIARDGLLVLIALAISGTSLALVIHKLLSLGPTS
jgi:hypothetical protein